MKIANQINEAFAQFALLGWVPAPKAHTNNIMMFTTGINVIKSVSTQFPVVTV